jgi:hypothetical protein
MNVLLGLFEGTWRGEGEGRIISKYIVSMYADGIIKPIEGC